MSTHEKVYIRFGDLPQGGTSIASYGGNGKIPARLPGVSVFTGYPAPDGDGYVVDTSARAAQASMYRLLVNAEARAGLRKVYLAEGKELFAWGSDGEDLLDARTVKLTPLPPGTLLRDSGHWSRAVPAVMRVSLLTGFIGGQKLVGGGEWAKHPAPPVRVNLPPPTPASEASSEAPADLPAFLDAVRERATFPDSPVHGEEHWKRVAQVALGLIPLTDGVDPLVVICFAIIHDSMRLFDGGDPWHGYRAARLAEEIMQRRRRPPPGSPASFAGTLLDAGQLRHLIWATENHAFGAPTPDPTGAVCWDADRLCLWRVGIQPDRRFLSTAAARLPEVMTWARDLNARPAPWGFLARGKPRVPEWEELFGWYEALPNDVDDYVARWRRTN